MFKYPMFNEWVSFDHMDEGGNFVFKDCLSGEEYTMGRTLGRFAMQLDGRRNPYAIKIEGERLAKPDVRYMLSELKRCKLIRCHRYMKLDSSLYILTLWMPRKTKRTKKVATATRALLQIIWFPAFIVGLWLLIGCAGMDIIDNANVACIMFWGLIHAVLHEMAHFLSAISFGNKAHVFELGIGLDGIIPFAYNLADTSRCSKIQHLIIVSAGPALDLTMFGIHMILAIHFDLSFCYSAAYESLFTAAVNLMPFFKRSDGSAIWREIRGEQVP